MAAIEKVVDSAKTSANDKIQIPSANAGPLSTLITVFFFWGFVAASNGIFIPFCKEHFDLNQFQSQWIDSAFYAAYFVGSLLLWLISQMSKIDILNKIGYRKGIICGLFISLLGSLIMIPAVHSGSYGFILSALFVIALGFSLQQTAAQPFVIALGTPETGAHRLNLAGGLNSFGTLIGPLMVSQLLFGKVSGSSSSVTISSIDTLYYLLSAVFVLAILLLGFAKLPRVESSEKFEPGFGALKYPQLKWG
ncbi:MAG: MFS transporter, partial [Crocinitomicaceae bacterium]|nr:MFS transporter [Crocinitomicaceae bacterium]